MSDATVNNQEPAGVDRQPLQEGSQLGQSPDVVSPSFKNSGVSLGRDGLIVRAGRHLYLHVSLQLLGWITALCGGAGVGGWIGLFR
jgi:hypothetical protein